MANSPKPINKIDQYLSKNKSSAVDHTVKDSTDEVSKFYTSRVVDQLKRNKCDDHACAHLKRELRQQLAQSKEKLAQTKGAIKVCERIIQQKNCKLNSLKGQLDEQFQAENRKEPEDYFNDYKNHFTTGGLSELRSIGGKKKDDSNFVLTGMRFLYRKQLHRLGSITVTGRSKKSKNDDTAIVVRNEKMSPKKLDALKGAFTERLNILQLDEKERKQRAQRLNILINHAIQNLNPNKNLKQSLDELNKQINLADHLLN